MMCSIVDMKELNVFLMGEFLNYSHRKINKIINKNSEESSRFILFVVRKKIRDLIFSRKVHIKDFKKLIIDNVNYSCFLTMLSAHNKFDIFSNEDVIEFINKNRTNLSVQEILNIVYEKDGKTSSLHISAPDFDFFEKTVLRSINMSGRKQDAICLHSDENLLYNSYIHKIIVYYLNYNLKNLVKIFSNIVMGYSFISFFNKYVMANIDSEYNIRPYDLLKRSYPNRDCDMKALSKYILLNFNGTELKTYVHFLSVDEIFEEFIQCLLIESADLLSDYSQDYTQEQIHSISSVCELSSMKIYS